MNRNLPQQGRHLLFRAMVRLGELYALKKLRDKVGEYVEINLTPKGKKLKGSIDKKTNEVMKSMGKKADKLIDKGLKKIGVRDYTMIEKIQNSWPSAKNYINNRVNDAYYKLGNLTNDAYYKVGNLTNYGIGKLGNLTNYGYYKLSNLTNYGIDKITALYHRPNATVVSVSNLSRSRN